VKPENNHKPVSAEQRLREVLQRTVTAQELSNMEFAPIKWIIPDLLPEGLAIIAGKPKTGKSFLALNMAVAVALGGRVFGNTQVERGEVLYIALEDGLRRLRGRYDMVKALPTDKLHFCTEWPRGQKGLEDLRLWLSCHEKCRLVILDTLARIRDDDRDPSYQRDYDFITELKKVADGRHIAFVLIHHTRKAAADDVLDQVSGTTGITGAADSLWILQRSRGKADATLTVSGRDFPEQELALKYQPEIGWSLMGNAEDVRMSDERRQILELLEDGPMSITEVSKDLGKNRNTTKNTMMKLKEAGKVVYDPQNRRWQIVCSPRSPHSLIDQTTQTTETTQTTRTMQTTVIAEKGGRRRK
jgi:DNA-binding transcriptional ArsR family regulator